MKSIFLILFYFACIIYCYGNLTNQNIIAATGLYSIVPCIFTHYIINNVNKINFFYLVALISSYIGIIIFYNNNIRITPPSLAGFSLFNLMMVIIVFEKMKSVNLKKVISITLILTITFTFITYKIFKFFDIKFFAITIYFISLSLMIAFSYFFWSENKSKIVSIYFLIGALSYILASISVEFLYLDKLIVLMTILNTLSYGITHYCYYKAVTLEDN